jgi:hypothetical protein
MSGPWVAVRLDTPGRFNVEVLDRRVEGGKVPLTSIFCLPDTKYLPETPASTGVDREPHGLLRSAFHANAGEECDRW